MKSTLLVKHLRRDWSARQKMPWLVNGTSSRLLGFLLANALLPIAASAVEQLTPKESAEYAVRGVSTERINEWGQIRADNVQAQSIFQNIWPAAVYESGLISDAARETAEKGQQLSNAAAAAIGLEEFKNNPKSDECITYLYLAYQSPNNRDNPLIGGDSAIECIKRSLGKKTTLLTSQSLGSVLANTSTETSPRDLEELQILLKTISKDLMPVQEFPYYQATYQLVKRMEAINKQSVITLWEDLYSLFTSRLRGSSYCGSRITAISNSLNGILMATTGVGAPDARKRQLDNTERLIRQCYSEASFFPTQEMMYETILMNMNSVILSLVNGTGQNEKESIEQESRAIKLASMAREPAQTSTSPHGLTLLDIEISHIGLLDARGATDQAQKSAIKAYDFLSKNGGRDANAYRYLSQLIALIPKLTSLELNDEASIISSRAEEEILKQSNIPVFQRTYAISLLSDQYTKANAGLKASALWTRYISEIFNDKTNSAREKADAALAFSSFVYFQKTTLYEAMILENREIKELSESSPLLKASIMANMASINLDKGNKAKAREYLLKAETSIKQVSDQRDLISVRSIEHSLRGIATRVDSENKNSVAYWNQEYKANLAIYGEMHRLTLGRLFDLGTAKLFSGLIEGPNGGFNDLVRFISLSKEAGRIEAVNYRAASLYIAILESFLNNDKPSAAEYLSEFYKSKDMYRRASLRFLDTDQTGKEIVDQLTTYLISPYILGKIDENIYREEINDLIVNRGLSIEVDIARRSISNRTSDSLSNLATTSKEIRRALNSQSTPVSVNELQRLLDDKTSITIVAIARPVSKEFLVEVGNDPSKWNRYDRYVLINISKDSVSKPIDVGEKSYVDELGAMAREEITSPSENTFSSLTKLRALWKQATDSSNKRFAKTHIIPAGIFAKIPQTLLDQHADEYKDGGLFVSESSLIRHLQGNQRKSTSSVVVFADPDYGGLDRKMSTGDRSRSFPRAVSKSGLWQRLPATLTEADFLREKVKASTYMGAEASRKNLLRVNSPKILHLATHAYYEDSVNDFREYEYSSPLDNTGIVFSGVNSDPVNSIATARDLLSLNLEGTELVVLSACESALGDIPTNMSVYGLQRAFEVAGAKAVLAALWKVDDKATAEFIKLFYAKILDNSSKREALHAAQEQFKVHPIKAWRHPYYWAAFELYGNPEALGHN